MNPFRIHKEEMNVEKTGFLKNLVLLIWKGTQEQSRRRKTVWWKM